jgi:hypothetical protein
MKLLVVLLSLLIAGCGTTVPVKQTFPDVGKSLQEKCPDLKTIEGERVSITDMLKVVVENYNTYYSCSNKVDGWNEWYVKQKEIFDRVNQNKK